MRHKIRHDQQCIFMYFYVSVELSICLAEGGAESEDDDNGYQVSD